MRHRAVAAGGCWVVPTRDGVSPFDWQAAPATGLHLRAGPCHSAYFPMHCLPPAQVLIMQLPAVSGRCDSCMPTGSQLTQFGQGYDGQTIARSTAATGPACVMPPPPPQRSQHGRRR